MAGFLRLIIGVLLLPAWWGAVRTLLDAVEFAADRAGVLSVETLALAGGIIAFSVFWVFASHPVRTYVFAHELTHALWGILFGARPSGLKVTAKGGSVRLTKTNLLITLAPYFFPFYTFVTILTAFATRLVLGYLPGLPIWLFLIGVTWAFHLYFTFEILTCHQPDVKTYGRVFSWAFIGLMNILIVLVGLVLATDLSFSQLCNFAAVRFPEGYAAIVNWTMRLFALRR